MLFSTPTENIVVHSPKQHRQKRERERERERVKRERVKDVEQEKRTSHFNLD
jgi:hypothetical protein